VSRPSDIDRLYTLPATRIHYSTARHLALIYSLLAKKKRKHKHKKKRCEIVAGWQACATTAKAEKLATTSSPLCYTKRKTRDW